MSNSHNLETPPAPSETESFSLFQVASPPRSKPAPQGRLRRWWSGALHTDVYPSLQFGFDALALMFAWTATVQAHQGLAAPVSPVPPIQVFLLWMAAVMWVRLYRHRTGPALSATLLRVLESAALMTLSVMVSFLLVDNPAAGSTRSFIFTFLSLSVALLLCSVAAAVLLAPRVESWVGPRRVAVVGDGDGAADFINRIRQTNGAAFRLAGIVAPEHGANLSKAGDVPVLGTISQLAELINRERLDRVIVAGSTLSPSDVDRCVRVSKRMGVVLTQLIEPAGPESVLHHRVVHGFHSVESKPRGYTRAGDLVTRAIDFTAAGAGLIALSPLLVVLAVMVRATSEGPIFYRSMRVGRGGRYFTFWKFRSMYTGRQSRLGVAHKNEKSGPLFKIKHDPRVTPLGRHMRRYSLDELPQLFNVLIGDMSLVGPRPLPVEDLDPDGMSLQFREWAEGRARVRPGITGLWQVRGRSELEFDDMMRLDLEYVANRSVWLDLNILAETPRVVLTGRGAC